MFPRGAPKVVGADEAKRREKWLDERSSFGNGVGRVLGGMARGVADRVSGRAAAEREEAARTEEEAARDSGRREVVDQAEAAWLIERITEDDVLHDNERALLAHIKRLASEIHPSLLPFMEKYGV